MADVDRWLAEPEAPEPYLQSTLYAKVALALMYRPPRRTRSSTPSAPSTCG